MQNCLVQTGTNITATAWIALSLIVLAAILFRRKKTTYKLRGLAVAGLLCSILLGTVPVSYAASCEGKSAPDTTVGAAGVVQSVNISLNDSPTPGAHFILGSLKLGLRTGWVLGASITVDNKMVTIPNEGVYVADSNATITFTPDPGFTGTASGVDYSISDSAGNTLTSTYTPTVTPTPVAICSDPASETRVLHTVTLNFDNLSGDGLTVVASGLAADPANAPALNPNDIDIDPATPGVQRTFTAADGIYTYDPSTDLLIAVKPAINDPSGASSSFILGIQYTIAAVAGCAQPAAAHIDPIQTIAIY